MIFKIIGIVIAIILGIILLLLFAILFVPVRYSSKGELNENKNISLSVGWLLHILHFGLSYDFDKLTYALRIFGIKVFSSDKKEKPEKKKEKSQKDKAEEKSDKNKSQKDTTDEDTKSADLNESPSEDRASDTTDVKDSRLKEKESIYEKLRKIFVSIGQKIMAVFNKIRDVFIKIQEIFKKIQRTLDFINDETTRTAVSYAKNSLFKLLKHYVPRKVTASLNFGFESPDVTGKALGYLSVLYAMLGKKAKNLCKHWTENHGCS